MPKTWKQIAIEAEALLAGAYLALNPEQGPLSVPFDFKEWNAKHTELMGDMADADVPEPRAENMLIPERFQISSIREHPAGDILAICMLGVPGVVPRTRLNPQDVVRIEVVHDVTFAAPEPKPAPVPKEPFKAWSWNWMINKLWN